MMGQSCPTVRQQISLKLDSWGEGPEFSPPISLYALSVSPTQVTRQLLNHHCLHSDSKCGIIVEVYSSFALYECMY